MTDPYLWLEDVTARPRSTGCASATPRPSPSAPGRRVRADAARAGSGRCSTRDDRIPYVRRARRVPLQLLAGRRPPARPVAAHHARAVPPDEPEWDVLLDLDALAADEGENWVWARRASVLRPEQRRALLSAVPRRRRRGRGARVRPRDARRSSTATASRCPRRRASVGWIDADTVYVGTDFGPGSLTDSGYPRDREALAARHAARRGGDRLRGRADDVSVCASHDRHARLRARLRRAGPWTSTTPSATSCSPDGALVRIDVPDDAGVDRAPRLAADPAAHRLDGRRHHLPGRVAAASRPSTRFLAGQRELTVLFAPDEHTSLDQATPGPANHLILVDCSPTCRAGCEVLTPRDDGLGGASLLAGRARSSTDERDLGTDPHDERRASSSTPAASPSRRRCCTARSAATRSSSLKQAPAFFDADGMTVAQFFATSDDGTAGALLRGRRRDDVAGPLRPTLLNGYGGFEISLTPGYSAVDRAGAGSPAAAPTWWRTSAAAASTARRGTRAALREDRHAAYEDFAAVAARPGRRAASPRRRSSASRAAATAGC